MPGAPPAPPPEFMKSYGDAYYSALVMASNGKTDEQIQTIFRNYSLTDTNFRINLENQFRTITNNNFSTDITYINTIVTNMINWIMTTYPTFWQEITSSNLSPRPPAPARAPARAPAPALPGTPLITLGNISPAGSYAYNVPVRWTSTNATGNAIVSISPVDSLSSFTPATSPGLNGSRNYVLRTSTTSTKTYTITVTTRSSTGHTATASKTVVIPKAKKLKGGTRRKLKKSRKSKKSRK